MLSVGWVKCWPGRRWLEFRDGGEYWAFGFGPRKTLELFYTNCGGRDVQMARGRMENYSDRRNWLFNGEWWVVFFP